MLILSTIVGVSSGKKKAETGLRKWILVSGTSG